MIFNNFMYINNILQQSDSVRPQYKTVDLSEIELPDVDTNNNTLLLEVSIYIILILIFFQFLKMFYKYTLVEERND